MEDLTVKGLGIDPNAPNDFVPQVDPTPQVDPEPPAPPAKKGAKPEKKAKVEKTPPPAGDKPGKDTITEDLTKYPFMLVATGTAIAVKVTAPKNKAGQYEVLCKPISKGGIVVHESRLLEEVGNLDLFTRNNLRFSPGSLATLATPLKK